MTAREPTYKERQRAQAQVADAAAAGRSLSYEDALAGVMAEAEAPAAPPLEFFSPDELLDTTPAEPEWLWDGYLAPGAITLLAGPPKRAGGKTTFAFALVRALLEGQEAFLGRLLAGGPVVYLSEEPAGLLRPKVEALRGKPLRIVWRETTPRPKPTWAESIRAATAEAIAIGARLVVIDTFAAWAGLKAESEKDAGAVEAAVEALKAAAACGLAILLVHHHRKGGGENGEAVRGSSALLGAVDISLDLTRLPGEDAPPRQRLLAAQSRWPGTPDALLVELAEDGRGYRLIGAGDRGELRQRAAEAPVLAALVAAGHGLTTDEVAVAVGQGRQAASKALLRLVKDGQAVRTGKGARGDPFHYFPAAEFLRLGHGAESAESATGGWVVSAPADPRRGSGAETQPGGGTLRLSAGAESGAPAAEDLERWDAMADGGPT